MRRSRRAWIMPLGVGPTLALAACSLTAFDPSPVPPLAPPQYDGADAGTLEISVGRERREPQDSIWAVTVSEPWPATWQMSGGSASTLPAGSYELTFFEQACGRTCESLGSPANQCTANVTIAPGTLVEVGVLLPDGPCEIMPP